MATLIRTVEARYPGTRIVIEPCGSPDDPDFRWWVWVLNAPEKEVPLVTQFATRLALELYDWHTPNFFVGAQSPRATRKFLARRRAAGAEERARVRRLGRARSRRPASRRAAPSSTSR